MTITRQDRNQEVDSRTGQLVRDEVVEVDVTAEVVELDLHQKARVALVANQTALIQLPAAQAAMVTVLANAQAVIDSTPANVAQLHTALDALAAEVRRMATVVTAMLTAQGRALRVDNQLIKLVIGSDLLLDDTATDT